MNIHPQLAPALVTFQLLKQKQTDLANHSYVKLSNYLINVAKDYSQRRINVAM